MGTVSLLLWIEMAILRMVRFALRIGFAIFIIYLITTLV